MASEPVTGRAGGVIVEAAQAACASANARLKEIIDAEGEQNPRLVIVTDGGKKLEIPIAALKPERGVDYVTRAIAQRITKSPDPDPAPAQ
jgi:hypothetical protein